jgi:hypothetical protein
MKGLKMAKRNKSDGGAKTAGNASDNNQLLQGQHKPKIG